MPRPTFHNGTSFPARGELDRVVGERLAGVGIRAEVVVIEVGAADVVEHGNEQLIAVGSGGLGNQRCAKAWKRFVAQSLQVAEKLTIARDIGPIVGRAKRVLALKVIGGAVNGRAEGNQIIESCGAVSCNRVALQSNRPHGNARGIKNGDLRSPTARGEEKRPLAGGVCCDSAIGTLRGAICGENQFIHTGVEAVGVGCQCTSGNSRACIGTTANDAGNHAIDGITLGLRDIACRGVACRKKHWRQRGHGRVAGIALELPLGRLEIGEIPILLERQPWHIPVGALTGSVDVHLAGLIVSPEGHATHDGVCGAGASDGRGACRAIGSGSCQRAVLEHVEPAGGHKESRLCDVSGNRTQGGIIRYGEALHRTQRGGIGDRKDCLISPIDHR